MFETLFEKPVQPSRREGIRELSAEEIIYIGGGDDGGCDCSCPADTSSASSAGGLSDTEAQNLVSNIDMAFSNPAFAFALFAATLANGMSATNPGVTSNPMGDPSPAGP